MKTIDLKDAVSGKELHIEFDLDKDIMIINGVKVERNKPFEQNDDMYIYVPIGSKSLETYYQLNKAQLNQMHAIWGIPNIP